MTAPELPENDIESVEKISDFTDILIRFSRKADHEIKFESCPSAFHGCFYSLSQLFLGKIFVNRIPETLGSGLDSKSKPCFSASGGIVRDGEVK